MLSLLTTAEAFWLTSWCLNAMLVCLSCTLQYSEPGGVFKGPTTSFKRLLPVYISFTWLIIVVLAVPRHDRMMSSVASLAALFYFTKTREQALEDRFQSEKWIMRVISVIGTFHDVQERTPAASLWWPRIFEIVWEVVLLCLHCAGCWLSRDILLRHDEVAMFLQSVVPMWRAMDLVLPIACVSSCTFAYFALHVYGDVISLIWIILGGFRLPLLMNHPERSLSVREFWTRWDVVIQKLLRKHVYTTLRDRGVGAFWAALATFASSGFLHVYPIAVSLGVEEWRSAAQMMSYFLIQFACMWVEGSFLDVKKWNPWAARIWVLICLFGPSYVLTAPVLRIMDIGVVV